MGRTEASGKGQSSKMSPQHTSRVSSLSATQTLAVLAFLALQSGVGIVVASSWDDEYRNHAVPATRFLQGQLGLLAWLVALANAGRFWRFILALLTLGSLIALVSYRLFVADFQILDPAWGYAPTAPWNPWKWEVWFCLEPAGRLQLQAPWVLVSLLVLGLFLPCSVAEPRQQANLTDRAAPIPTTRVWQFRIRDLLGATASVALLLGLVLWIQPYPTWAIEYGRNAIALTREDPMAVFRPIPAIVVITWLSARLLLCERMRWYWPIVVIFSLVLSVVAAIGAVVYVPFDLPIDSSSTIVECLVYLSWDPLMNFFRGPFMNWTFLGPSFLPLRLAGFRVTCGRGRVLRWFVSRRGSAVAPLGLCG